MLAECISSFVYSLKRHRASLRTIGLMDAHLCVMNLLRARIIRFVCRQARVRREEWKIKETRSIDEFNLILHFTCVFFADRPNYREFMFYSPRQTLQMRVVREVVLVGSLQAVSYEMKMKYLNEPIQGVVIWGCCRHLHLYEYVWGEINFLSAVLAIC